MRWKHILLLSAVATAIFSMMICSHAFVVNSYAKEWREEQLHLDGFTALSPNGNYIPNLDLEFETILDERYHKFFPFVDTNIFERVTVLNHLGPASSYDFSDCLAFQYVHTIRIDQHNDTVEIVKVFKKFPRLKTVEVWFDQSQYDGTSIVDLIRKEIPDVYVEVR